MKIFFASCYLLGMLAEVYGLKCMTCEDADSFEECDVKGMLQKCMPNQKSCETIVRRHGDDLSVTKRCKNAGACRSNQLQNYGRSGESTQCNSDQTNSICTCCCETDLCNSGAPTCVDHYRNTSPVNDCPQVPVNFPHGNIECYNENKAGSVCEYQCKGQDYAVWPKGRDTNVCLGNGTWAHAEPCCTRPCPPYYLLDDVLLVHFSDIDPEFFLFLLSQIAYGAIAEDATKISVMYFSGQPIESTAVKFNDYGSDAGRLQQVTLERMKIVNEGPVNIGAAIRYALDNLLTEEAGMRDSRVPKTLNIITDRNSDDDIKAVSEEARRRGVLVYALPHLTEGYEFDHKQLLDITADEEHIFPYSRDDPESAAAQMQDITNHFCKNPCDHVLHAHP